MSLNFLGLGFSFGIKDKGLGRKQKDYSEGFETMADKMSEVSKSAAGLETSQRRIGGGFNFIRDAMEKLDTIVRQSKLQTFVQSISLARLNDIANSIGDISDSGRNLTTGLEAEMTALSTSTRATGANFGYTGKALSKFSSQAAGMAKALNVDANVAAQALRGWNEAGSELSAVGIRSAKDLARFSAAFGVNADTLRNSTLQMRKEFGFSDKEINKVVGSFTKMGQQTGDVAGALNQLPEVMTLLRRRAATMGATLDKADLAKFGAQTAGLAAGFMQMGHSSDKARASAVAMAETMIASKENFGKLFAGTADDLSSFQKEIGIAFGDIGISFDSLKQSPADFVAGLAGIIAQAKKTGRFTDASLGLIQGRLSAAFGDEKSAELVNFFRTADASILETMSNVEKAPADLGKMAREAHRTGRTLQDTFELAKDSFIMNFRAISRKEARSFVRDTGAAFKDFNVKLREIAGKGGLMGAFVKKMAEAHQIGVQAFIPEALRPMTTIMGTLTKEMTPAITALGALGFRMKMLVNPFVLAGVAIGGVFLLYKKNEKELMKTNKTFQQQTKVMEGLQRQLKRTKEGSEKYIQIQARIEQQEKQLSATRAAISAEARTKTVAQIKKGIEDAIVKIKLVGQVLLEELKHWWPMIRDFAVGLWDALIYGVDPKQGGQSGASQWGLMLGQAIRHGLSVAVDYIKNYIKQWWSKMVGIWSDDSLSFTDKVRKTMEGSAGIIIGALAVARFVPGVGALSGFLFKTMGSILIHVVKWGGQLLLWFGKIVAKSVWHAGKMLASWLWAHRGMIADIAKTVIKYIANFALITAAAAYEAGKVVLQWAKVGIGMLADVVAPAAKAVVGFGRMAAAAVAARVPMLAALGPVGIAIGALVIAAYKLYQAWDDIKGLAKEVKDLAVDTVTGSMFGDVAKREKFRLEGLRTELRDMGRFTDAQIEDMLQKVDKSNAMLMKKNVDHFRMADAIRYAEGDIAKAIEISGNSALMAAQKIQYRNKLEEQGLTLFQDAENKKRGAVKQTTSVLVQEGLKQLANATAMAGSTSNVLKGMLIGPFKLYEKFKKKLDIKAEDPAASVIIGEGDMAKLGPQAMKAFGKAGQAMDKFGGVFLEKFEGAKSIDEIAGKSFDRILKSSQKLKKDLSTIMKDLWMEILERTAKAVEALQKDSISVSKQLQAIARVSSIVASDQTAAMEAAGGEAPKAQRTFRTDENSNKQIYEAIHNPEWYWKSFYNIATGMNANLSALVSASSAPGPARSAAAAEIVRARRASGNPALQAQAGNSANTDPR